MLDAFYAKYPDNAIALKPTEDLLDIFKCRLPSQPIDFWNAYGCRTFMNSYHKGFNPPAVQTVFMKPMTRRYFWCYRLWRLQDLVRRCVQAVMRQNTDKLNPVNACKLLLIAVIFCLMACGQANKQNQLGDSVLIDTPRAISTQQRAHLAPEGCIAGEKLVYRSESFESYTEDKMRGKGVITFHLDLNTRLDIYY